VKVHLVTATVLVAAIACYLLGLKTGFVLLVPLGLFLEGVVWMRSRRGSKLKGS
jgi:hypothetical protein